MSLSSEQMAELVKKVDPGVLLTWISYMRLAWCNPSDRDVVTASHRYENRHMEELREVIDALHGLTPEYRPFWPPLEDSPTAMMKGLTLRQGTLYAVEKDGVLSEKLRLEEDALADLLAATAMWRVYRLTDGRKVYVQPEDDAPAPATEP